jgi:formylglycine-generating enzyme required for sulfatase activity
MSGLRPSRALVRVVLVALALAGCSLGSGSRGSRAVHDAGVEGRSAPTAMTRHAVTQASSESATERQTSPPRAAAPRAGETVSIAAGPMRAGSLPGTAGRAPGVEADLLPVALPAFTIDRLPYPNDPSLAPRAAVSRDEAASLCSAEGKRLCSELEWERACEGATNDAAPLGAIYPGGSSFDPETCGLDALACASPEGVLSLGTSLGEWTASAAPPELAQSGLDAIVRGGAAISPAAVHRCAARRAFPSATKVDGLGFRCCGGEAPSIPYPTVARARSMFQDRAMETVEARRILASVPEVARFAARFSPYDADDVDRALGRGGLSREALGGWALMAGVLVWAPADGEQAWVFAGTSGPDSLIAVLYPMPDGTFVHAASFILENEATSIAIAYGVTAPRELLWSTCWGCGGEGGAVTLKDDATIVITQR